MGRLATPGRSLRIDSVAVVLLALAVAHGAAAGVLAVGSSARDVRIVLASTESGTVRVRALDNIFEPASLVITAGTSVSFINDGQAPHTMTAVDQSFDSGIIPAAGTWMHAFDAPGIFPFICILHPGMEGRLEVVAPGSDDGPAPSAPETEQKEAVVVSIDDDAFRPPGLTVEAGATILWVNNGAAPHTVTDPAGSFDSRLVLSGDSWSRQFTEPGTYAIFCAVHPEMTGNILVIAARPSTTPGASPTGTESPSGTASATGPAASATGTDPGRGAVPPIPGPPESLGRAIPIPVVIFGVAVIVVIVAIGFFVRAVTEIVEADATAGRPPGAPGSHAA